MKPWSIRVFAAVAALSMSGCLGKYIRPTTDEKLVATPERVERGKYLANAVGACGGCHTSRAEGSITNPEDADKLMGGGNVLDDGTAVLYMPNLTSDVETGLGAWSDDEVMRAIRDGISRDGRVLFPIMPYGAYQAMSDDDVKALVVYLRSLPAVKPVLPRRPNEIPFGFKMALGMGVTLHAPAHDVKAPPATDPVAYGKYIAELGHCVECHSFGGKGPRAADDRFMAGSDEPFALKGIGKIWAPNLTPDTETGIGRVNDEQLKAALRSGKRLDGKLMAPPMSVLMPHYATMTDEDLTALVAWLRSLPPVKQAVPTRALEAAFAKQLGE